MRAKLNIPFDIELTNDLAHGLSFFVDVHGVHGVYASSEAVAKKKLRKELEAHLKLAFNHYDHRYNRYVLGAGDGTVFIVSHNGSGYEYRIHGPGRKNGSATVGVEWSFEEAIIAARKHAIDSFNGIVWENRS